MRVLVTGHNGYIGSVLVPCSSRRGTRSSDSTPTCSRAARSDRRQAGESLRKDVRDVETGRSRPASTPCIHLAAVCNDPVGDLNPQATYDINHLASVRLAEMAKQAGVERFLFSSSCSLYGKAGDDDRSTRARGSRR